MSWCGNFGYCYFQWRCLYYGEVVVMVCNNCEAWRTATLILGGLVLLLFLTLIIIITSILKNFFKPKHGGNENVPEQTKIQ